MTTMVVTLYLAHAILRQNEASNFWTISALACQLALASVLAIDYGTDFITASLMKPWTFC